MHLETDPKTHGHFEQTRVGKTTVNSRLFVPNVLDYEQNPNQIMNDIIKLRHSSNGDTYKFHRIFPLDFYVAILTFIPIVDRHPCKKGFERVRQPGQVYVMLVSRAPTVNRAQILPSI